MQRGATERRNCAALMMRVQLLSWLENLVHRYSFQIIVSCFIYQLAPAVFFENIDAQRTIFQLISIFHVIKKLANI